LIIFDKVLIDYVSCINLVLWLINDEYSDFEDRKKSRNTALISMGKHAGSNFI